MEVSFDDTLVDSVEICIGGAVEAPVSPAGHVHRFVEEAGKAGSVAAAGVDPVSKGKTSGGERCGECQSNDAGEMHLGQMDDKISCWQNGKKEQDVQTSL